MTDPQTSARQREASDLRQQLRDVQWQREMLWRQGQRGMFEIDGALRGEFADFDQECSRLKGAIAALAPDRAEGDADE